jgi:outer membrane protein TolC
MAGWYGRTFKLAVFVVQNRQDGKAVVWGKTSIVPYFTPGHTKGCTSWTTQVEEAGRRYDVLIASSMTAPGYRLVDNAAYRVLRRKVPGPFTFILPATRLVPDLVLRRQKTVGIRIPDSTIALEIVRRRTVLAIYQAYLGLARQEEARRIAADRVARARQLTEFSRARFAAGSVSRLDVLRAEQQEASAVVAENDASNLVEDFRDALRRAAGLTPDLEFSIAAPAELPQPEPPLPESLADLPERRPEALEARDQIRDAEFAVRIAKSLELPSISGVLAYDAGATGASAGDALHPRNPSLLFGVRSQYGLNIGILAAQRRQAEITLTTRRRDARLLEEDLAREVRRAYRRLDALARDYRIASQNQQVAELQARVAQLRFEKGLSDNFNVVDAENLLNAARLLELDSRFSTLLARLDCLYSSGRLNLPPFLEQP